MRKWRLHPNSEIERVEKILFKYGLKKKANRYTILGYYTVIDLVCDDSNNVEVMIKVNTPIQAKFYKPGEFTKEHAELLFYEVYSYSIA